MAQKVCRKKTKENNPEPIELQARSVIKKTIETVRAGQHIT